MDYDIRVELDDKEHILRGHETIRYINKAPDSLQCIYMHLWPDAYRNNSTALAQQIKENSRFTGGGEASLYFARPDRRGRIDSLDFKVNGDSVAWERDSQHIDIAYLDLNKALGPGDTIEISTPFRVVIPEAGFSRLGHQGQSYQITQWYPKPAVFDHNGWHEMPYLDQGEFYSEFATYDVRITLPENYVVQATGQLQDPSELEWLRKKAKETRKKGDFDDAEMDPPPSSNETKTLHYHQDRVHDFAWFADKRYNVMIDTAKLPGSDKTVETWVMFTDKEGGLWKKGAGYVADAIEHYSSHVGPYPYEKASAVQGALGAGSGMEYPMVTVIGEAGSAFSLDRVIAHEVGHNWFYGILGSNERRHPWMDEGMNSYYEGRYIEKKYAGAGALKGSIPAGARDMMGLKGKGPFEQHYLIYGLNARREMDQPPGARSSAFTPINYGGMVYSKSAMLFNYLAEYLGRSVFNEVIQAYYEEWKFRHPEPADVVSTFEKETGKDLSWFWKMFRTDKKLDYKASSVTHRTMRYGEEYELTIKNKGDIIAPVPISIIQDDTVARTLWKAPVRDEKTLNMGYFPGQVQAFMIDGRRITPDVNRNNNMIRTKGPFKKVEPPSFRPLFSIEDPLRTQIHYSPIAGWNKYDGTMAGIGLYNHTVPEPPVDYTLAPFYAFGSSALTGTAKTGWNHHFGFDGPINHLRLEAGAKRFHYLDNASLRAQYTRYSSALKFTFGKGDPRSRTKHAVQYRFIRVEESATAKGPLDADRYADLRDYHTGRYNFILDHPLRPFELSLKTLSKTELFSVSLELEQTFLYGADGKGLDLRFFAGKHVVNETVDPRFNWRMDGVSGAQDHTYEHSFFGRRERDGLFSRQFVPRHGGFKVPTAHGQSPDMLTALNIGSDLPGMLPLKVFADLGYDHEQERSLYDGGVELELIEDIASVYFPLVYSDPINEELKINDEGFGSTIRFTLLLNELAPFERLRKIGP